MKKFKYIWLMICLALLPACTAGQPGETGQSTQGPTWQEQYDLGLRYLEEGNYEEAILAFTAAIEIDPKRAPAYVGRGDAYVKSGETESNLAAAKADYEKAIELNETGAEAYLGLADVYIRQGDVEKALEVLARGLEKTGDNQSIMNKIIEVQENLEIEVGDTVLFSQYNIEDFVQEEEFTIGGISFYKLSLLDVAGYLSDISDVAGWDGIIQDHGGTNSCYASREVDGTTTYSIICCDQYSGSETINEVQYCGYYEGHIIEKIKTEIRDVSIGDSMGTVLEKIGITPVLAKSLVKTGLSITIGADHSIAGGYGWLTVVRSGGGSI